MEDLAREARLARSARAELVRSARDLLDIYEREPAIWSRLMKLVTDQDIETLREIAGWEADDGNGDGAL